MSSKDALHKLVETLPECEIDAAEVLLQHLHGIEVDPLLLKLYSSPWDDEPVTEEEREAFEEAKQEIARGEGIPMDEIKREFGISGRSE